MPESIGRLIESKKLVAVACRGVRLRPNRPSMKCMRSGPEIRTIPIAPRPGAVATAAIVSGFTSSGFGLLERPHDVPLLGNRKDVIYQPVQHETGREKEEEDAERNGHDLH